MNSIGAASAASAACATLNRRFSAERVPTNDWSRAGVLLRVLDGDGTLSHFPDADSSLWNANLSSNTGDRAAATLVNARHWHIYRCREGCSDDAKYNPGLVLAPTHATIQRIKCLYHHDVGTLRFNCRPHRPRQRRMRRGCDAGCSPHVCGVTYRGDRHYPWPATFWCHWQAEQLALMMAAQDYQADDGFGGFSTSDWEYNEIILDNWKKPWGSELASIIEAIFVQAKASPTSKQRARLLQRVILDAIGPTANETHIPLVVYDPESNQTAPFMPYLGS